MPEQTIYALVDPDAPDAIRYVGRSNKPAERLRFHAFNPFDSDASPRGLWVGYLWYAGRTPEMTILEQRTFDDKHVSESWAKDRERYWIRHCRENGDAVLNREGWWTHHTRKAIPKGVRAAWEQIHVSLFWFDFAAVNIGETLTAIDSKLGRLSLFRPITNGKEVRDLLRPSGAASDYERGRRGLVDAIRAIAAEYPSIAVAPLLWIERSTAKTWCFDGWELQAENHGLGDVQ